MVLDGLGSHSSTAWAEEKLRQIVNRRFVDQLPTVVTVSGNLDALDSYILARLKAPGFAQVVEADTAADPAIFGGRIDTQQLASQTFEAFHVHHHGLRAFEEQSLTAARDAAQAFAKNPDSWLVLSGLPGPGKTHQTKHTQHTKHLSLIHI